LTAAASSKKMRQDPSGSSKQPSVSMKYKPLSKLEELEKKREAQMSRIRQAKMNAKDFDAAMKLYTAELAADKGKYMQSPQKQSMKKPKKRRVNQAQLLKSQNSSEHLGGIFSIHNGWDQELPSKKVAVADEIPKIVVPRVDRVVPTPPMHTQIYDRDLDDENLINESYDYRIYNAEGSSQSSSTVDSDEESSNLVIDEKTQEVKEEESSSSESFSDDFIVVTQQQSTNSKELNQSDDDDDDVLSLEADFR
jgi:hypothetical protein